ncbi:MAG: DUF192 domain-containing protein [Lentimonas sp.]
MKACCRIFIIFSLTCCLLACTQKTKVDAQASTDTFFFIQIGEATTQLQLALTSTEQQKGLMHRTSLDKDHGMLFLFPNAEQRGFWMRNTLIKLDIGYFDESGKLLETHSLYPHDETAVKSYSHEVLIAVEMTHGWFAKHKVRPGAKINLKQLSDALNQRGDQISNYPIKPAN